MSPRGGCLYIFPPKKQICIYIYIYIFLVMHDAKIKAIKAPSSFGILSQKKKKVPLAFSTADLQLTDTGQLPITSRHYGYKSTETCNSTASSRWRRQRFLCNSHSLLILHLHLCHGTYVLYIKLYQLITQCINIPPPPLCSSSSSSLLSSHSFSLI